jgi:hypothetical protein
MEKELLGSSTGTGSCPSTSTVQNLQFRDSPAPVGLHIGGDGDTRVRTEKFSLGIPVMALPQFQNPVFVGSG